MIKPDQHAGPSQPPPLSYNRFEISVLGPGSRECRRDGTFRTILHRFAWGCTQGCESSGQFSIPDPNPGCDRCVMVTRTRARLLLVVFFVGAPEIFDPPRRSHAAHGAWGGRAPEKINLGALRFRRPRASRGGVLHPAQAVRQQYADPTPAVRKVKRCPDIERHPGLRTTTFVTAMLMFVVGKTSPAVTTYTSTNIQATS